MRYLIKDNAIAGTTTQSDNLPDGFTATEGPDVPIDELYWNGNAIALKPPKPFELAFWDIETNQWREPSPSLPIPPAPNWTQLINLLENSPEWGRAYSAAERTLKANTAFTTLLTTLTSLRSAETLQFSIAKLREAMSSISGIGDFLPEEITSINQKLKDTGFDFKLSTSID